MTFRSRLTKLNDRKMNTSLLRGSNQGETIKKLELK